MIVAKSMSFRVLAVALLAVMSVLAAACGTAVAGDPTGLVPARANLVGSADLPEILSDEDVGEFYSIIAEANGDPEMPQTLEELLAFAEEQTCLDLTTLGEAIIFAEISDFESADLDSQQEEGYFGLIAAGAPDGLFEKVQESAPNEFDETEYKGVALLESTDDSMAIAIVDGAAVVGTLDAVRGVIDVDQGDADALSGDLLAFYDSIGDVWGKVVLTVPAEAKAELDGMAGEEMGLPVDVSALLDVEAIGISGDKQDNDGVLRVVLRYATEQQVTEAEGMINSLLTLVKMFAGDDPALDALDKLDISVAGTDLTIEVREDIEAAKEQLRQLIASSGGMMGF